MIIALRRLRTSDTDSPNLRASLWRSVQIELVELGRLILNENGIDLQKKNC